MKYSTLWLGIILMTLTACGGGASSNAPTGLTAPAWINSGVRIMPLGDSITEGYPSTNGGYRYELYRRFIDRNLAVNFVGGMTNSSAGLPDPNHEGHGGWTSNEIRFGRTSDPGAGNIDSWIQTEQPQIILLMIGTNDLFWTLNTQEISQNIFALVDHIRTQAPDTELFIGTPPPSRYGNMNPYLTDLSAAISQGITARMETDTHVHLVNTHDVLTQDDLATDGIHINPRGQGNGLVAEAWYQAILSSVERLSQQP